VELDYQASLFELKLKALALLGFGDHVADKARLKTGRSLLFLSSSLLIIHDLISLSVSQEKDPSLMRMSLSKKLP
jgi:hypothetical protein